MPPAPRTSLPNQLKSRREQIQQRRLATVRSRITELEAKRKKGRITEKEKSLLNSLRQYLANQKRLNRERTTKRLAKLSTAPAPAKPSTLTSPKPPSIPKPPILPTPPKPAPKKN